MFRAGRKLSISASAAIDIVKRWRTTGSYKPLRMGGHRCSALEKDRSFIEEMLEDHDDWSEAAMASHLAQERDIDVHPSTVGRFVRQLDWRYKKTVLATEQDRADVKEARQVWKEWQKTCDPSKLVFLDETGAQLLLSGADMTPRYGRTKGGARCLDTAPGGHWKTMTFIAGLRLNEITAPWCLDKAMTGQAFKTYLKTQLLPTLRPGDIVIADNLSSHKVAGVKDIIETAGAKILYLPPYSPDLKPIEQVFAKLKALLRRAMARSYETLWKTIGKLLARFSKQECQNYFRNSGYDCT